jgi:hypothetical protein
VSTANSVTSSSHGEYSGSSRVSRAPSQAAYVLPDLGSPWAFGGVTGQVFYSRITGSTSGRVWGTQVYTSDSVLAVAAVHAGFLSA